jgi:hypothetical protein
MDNQQVVKLSILITVQLTIFNNLLGSYLQNITTKTIKVTFFTTCACVEHYILGKQ